MRILVALLLSVSLASANPLIVLSGSPPVAAGGGPTLVLDVEVQGAGGGGTTAAVDTTGATLIVVCLGYYSGATINTFTDSKSNTWTALTARGGSVSGARIYYCISPTVGSGHTFTFDGLNIYALISVLAFSGINAFVAENGATTSASTTLATGSVSPGGNNRVFVSMVTTDQAGSLTIGSSFIKTSDNPYTGGTYMGSAAAYKIQTTGAAENPTWTFGAAINSTAAAIAVFSGP